jgi:hypothetical protein
MIAPYKKPFSLEAGNAEVNFFLFPFSLGLIANENETVGALN